MKEELYKISFKDFKFKEKKLEEIQGHRHIKEKKFEPFPVRSIRASDKVWNAIQKKRGGVSWNKFLLELVNK